MRFASARKTAGLTQKTVADKLGVDQSTVCLWEAGRTCPRAETLVRVAALYGCLVDDLLKEDA